MKVVFKGDPRHAYDVIREAGDKIFYMANGHIKEDYSENILFIIFGSNWPK